MQIQDGIDEYIEYPSFLQHQNVSLLIVGKDLLLIKIFYIFRRVQIMSRKSKQCLPSLWRMDQMGRKKLGSLMWRMAMDLLRKEAVVSIRNGNMFEIFKIESHGCSQILLWQETRVALWCQPFFLSTIFLLSLRLGSV